MTIRKWMWGLAAVLMLVLAVSLPLALAQVHGADAAKTEASTGRGLLGLGAGLAIGLAGFGTGFAQSRIGAAGVGALAENPKLLGSVILLVAIPETIVILGFVIGVIILG
jgi:V/A-type H+-transporting ATPase subunit K